jgi:hypothetical protein
LMKTIILDAIIGEAQMKIYICEEYGYREWIWDYPGTVEELISDWKAGIAPLNFMNPSEGTYRGTMIQITDDDLESVNIKVMFPIRGHVHMEDDTYLEVDGVSYTPDIFMQYLKQND